LLKNNDGLTSRQTHHPTKNLTIQIMENKERFTTQRVAPYRITKLSTTKRHGPLVK